MTASQLLLGVRWTVLAEMRSTTPAARILDRTRPGGGTVCRRQSRAASVSTGYGRRLVTKERRRIRMQKGSRRRATTAGQPQDARADSGQAKRDLGTSAAAAAHRPLLLDSLVLFLRDDTPIFSMECPRFPASRRGRGLVGRTTMWCSVSAAAPKCPRISRTGLRLRLPLPECPVSSPASLPLKDRRSSSSVRGEMEAHHVPFANPFSPLHGCPIRLTPPLSPV